jgi:basic amino acid/polyamine antiporter, APA family
MPPQLLRKLGVRDAALLVMGGIVGSGIFVNPSRVAKMVHTTPLIMLAWTSGGLIALIGAGVFAELGARRPKDGGVYAYLRDAYHPVVAFCYGWTLLLVSQSGGTAAAAVTFAFYLPKILPTLALNANEAKVIAIAVIALFTAINCLGVRSGTNTQNGFMIAKIVAILGVIGAGVFAIGHVSASIVQPLPTNFNPLYALGLAFVPVMFAYSGWQTTSFMSGEMKNVERTLPLGMLFGVLGVIVLYLGMNIVCIAVLGPAGLAATNTPASDVVHAALGQPGAIVMASIIALSTLGFIVNQILSSPRVYYQMAADGTFFKALANINPRTHVPILAIAVQGIAAMLIAASGQYDQILNWVTCVDYVFFGFAALALILFRRADEKSNAPTPFFRIPLHPWSTLLFLVVAWGIVVDLAFSSWRDTALGIIVLLSGVPVYWFFSRSHARRAKQ